MTIALGDWPQMMPLVEQAIMIPAGERGAWLARLDLAPSILDALCELLEDRLAIEDSDFLGALPRLALSAATPVTDRLESGATIGAWRLLHELGQGGMSTVWLAERADGQVTRQVALKIPHAGPGQHTLAMRLLRERNILAALEHPHIGRLYEVGLTAVGTPYLAMEFVAGRGILEHADGLGLRLAHRVDLFQQVLSAVQYAHSQMILHRDLKPANILVDASGNAKLLDFGIAKALADDGNARDATELTRAAGRLLTPAYASPEQLRGLALSTASDVYSLGVVLHELLTGQRPCGVSADSSAASAEHAILNVEPRPPSRGELSIGAATARGETTRSLRAQLAGDLDAVVLKALAKAPAKRYASPGEFAADLARWQSGKPVSVRTPSLWYYGRKFVGRHRLTTSLGALALVAVVAAAGVAVGRSVEAQRQAAKANAARQFMQDLFQNSDPDLNAGNEPTARELLARGRTRLIKAALTDTALPVDELLVSIARAQFEQGDAAAADETLALLLDRLQAAPDSAQLISAWLLRAEIALGTRDIDKAKAALAKVQAETKLHGADRAAQRQLLDMEGFVALNEDRPADARAAFDRYLRSAADAPDEPPNDVVAARLALAKIESMTGHRDAAQTLLADAFAQAARHPELDLFRFGDLALYRANIEVEAGRYATVASWLPATLADCVRALSERSSACRSLDAQLVRVLLKQGDAARAAKVAEALHRQMEDTRIPARQVEAAVLIARSLAWAGRDAELPASVEELTALGDSAASVRPPQRLLTLNTLAEVSLLAGRPDEALAWVARARELANRERLSGSREAAKTGVFEGAALQAKGRPELALKALYAQCDEASLSASKLPVLDRFLSLNCARSLVDVGRPAEALALVTQAWPVLRDGLGPEAPTVRRVEALLHELRSSDAGHHDRALEFFF